MVRWVAGWWSGGWWTWWLRVRYLGWWSGWYPGGLYVPGVGPVGGGLVGWRWPPWLVRAAGILVVCRLDGGPLAVLACPTRPPACWLFSSGPAPVSAGGPDSMVWRVGRFRWTYGPGGGLYGIPGCWWVVCWWVVWWWAARWVVDFGWYVCNLGGQQGEESSPTRGRAPSQQNPPPALHNPTVRGQVPEPYGDPQRRRAHDDLPGWPGTRPATNPAECVARTPLRRRARSHYDTFQKERMAGCANIGESRCTMRRATYCDRHIAKTTMKARFCCARADPAGGVKSCRDVCGGVFCRKWLAAIRQARAILPHYFIAFIIVIVDSAIITSEYLRQQ